MRTSEADRDAPAEITIGVAEGAPGPGLSPSRSHLQLSLVGGRDSEENAG